MDELFGAGGGAGGDESPPAGSGDQRPHTESPMEMEQGQQQQQQQQEGEGVLSSADDHLLRQIIDTLIDEDVSVEGARTCLKQPKQRKVANFFF